MENFLNKITVGDCLDLMRELPEESVDIVVTSPPYNLRNSSGNGMQRKAKGRWENSALVNGYDTSDDNMPHDEYVEWQRNCLTEMMRVIKDDGAIFYNHKWRVQKGLIQDRSDIVHGFPVRQIIIWKRSGGINFNDSFFLPTYEVIYLICKPKFKLVKGANGIGDIWSVPQTRGINHPAPFPVLIPQYCIEATRPDVVLDPFIGSGSTAIAANICNTNWIGFEISDTYAKIAEERIKEES